VPDIVAVPYINDIHGSEEGPGAVVVDRERFGSKLFLTASLRLLFHDAIVGRLWAAGTLLRKSHDMSAASSCIARSVAEFL